MKKITLICLIFVLIGCDHSKLSETPDSLFIGTWEFVDRGMFDNIEIEITKEKDGRFIGTVKKINEDKYVKLFIETGDLLLTDIKRSSNYQFVLTEKKIAAPLFSLYGQETSIDLLVTFETNDTILLGKNGENGKYVRVK